MEDLALSFRGLSKQFGGNLVLDGIDLDIRRGTIFGYIGPNGAGKSTTVKILSGLLPDYSGEVNVLGFDPSRDSLEIKRRIGYVPENADLFEQLTVAEHLLLVGRLHGMRDGVVRDRSRRMLAALDLEPRIGSRISTLSKGMRQKLLLVSALLHDPELIVLDEPLSGLDVNATILIKEFLRVLAERGKTIFYCSHVMDVVERICDRIAILDGGRIVAQGSFEELQAHKGGGTLEHIFAALTGERGESSPPARAMELADALASSPAGQEPSGE